MKIKSILVFVVAAALMMSSIPASAADGSVKIVVDNKSDSAGKLTISGPQYYSFDLKAGKNRFNVVSGTYSYSFFGCGRYQYGSFDAARNNARLTLDCQAAAGAEMVPLKVNNQSGSEFTLTLSGDGYYRFTIKKGANAFEIKAGQYSYSYDACGSQESGKLKSNAKGANLNIKKCAASRAGSSKGISVSITNNTGGTLTFYVSGTGSHSYTVPPGKTSFQVPAGTYQYRATAWCGSITGNLKANGRYRFTYTCVSQ